MYDVAIIGAGTAGLSARKIIAKKTDNYVVIDPGPLGTTCARVGCMPSKVLIQTANDYHRKGVFFKSGIEGSEKISINSEKVMNHVRELRDRFVNGVVEGIDSWQKDHLISKKAKFIDKNTLDIEGKVIKAKKIIIATGSSNIIPEKWQKYKSYFYNSDNIFELDKLPKKIAVIGLGVIGLELGQALSRLDVEVVGFGKSKKLANITDPKVLENIQTEIEKEFKTNFGEVEIIEEKNNQLILKSGDKTSKFSHVFLSIGRKPNLDYLGLSEIGIELNEKGIPIFDPNTYKIKDFPIYIAGDVNNERPILHEAADQGRIVGFNSINQKEECFSKKINLGIVFTDPNIAVIGKSFKELSESNIDFLIGEVDYAKQGRAIVKQKNKGLIRIYAEEKTGKLLGSEIFAPEGEHMAHLIAWCISLDLSVIDLIKMPFYHPVLEEGLRTALKKIAFQLKIKKDNIDLIRCDDNLTNRLN